MAQAARQLKTNADVVLLAWMGSAALVGFYSAAYRLVMVVNMMAGLFATALLPAVTRGYAAGGEWRDGVRNGIRLAAAMGALVAVVGVPTAGAAVVALFGPDYEPAAALMPVLMAAAALLFPSAALGNVAVGVNRQRVFAQSGMLVAVFNVACNLFLIPRMGASGAAVATLLSELVLAVMLAVRLWHNGVSEAVWDWWTLRLVGVAIISGVTAFWLVGWTNWVVTAGLTTALFSAAAVLAGVVSLDEVRRVGSGESPR